MAFVIVNSTSDVTSTFRCGLGNVISGNTQYSGVLAGRNNTAMGGSYQAILGGFKNTICGDYGVIAGGCANAASVYSFIGGGRFNLNKSTYSFIGGGYCNQTSLGSFSSVLGGRGNLNYGCYSSILGGFSNVTRANWSTIVGGYCNILASSSLVPNCIQYSFIGGGSFNRMDNGVFQNSMIGAGSKNTIIGANNGFIGAGNSNTLPTSSNVPTFGPFIGSGQTVTWSKKLQIIVPF